MGRHKNPGTDTLVQYATKVSPELKETLAYIAKTKGAGYGQRDLLEDMVGLYFEKHPEEKAKIEQLVSLTVGGIQ